MMTPIRLTSFQDQSSDFPLLEVSRFSLPHLSWSFQLNSQIFLNFPPLLPMAPVVSSSLYKDLLFPCVQAWWVFRGEMQRGKRRKWIEPITDALTQEFKCHLHLLYASPTVLLNQKDYNTRDQNIPHFTLVPRTLEGHRV